MTSTTEEEYPLDRSPLGSSRLYTQHFLWQRLIGHLLHPDIPIQENMKIADIACGTGIWLLDLAQQLSKSNTPAQLDGFDISTAQYPPSELLPPNLTLQTLDIFKPIPHAWRGQYDVIHIALLCLVIRDGDPRSVLDNLLTLLKPGGYIQWKEVDFSMMHITSYNPGISTCELSKLKQWIYEVPLKKYPDFDWIRHLSTIFHERDLTILSEQIVIPEAEITYAWNWMHMDGIQELITVHVNANANIAAGGSREREGERERELLELHRRAKEEVRGGACLVMALVNVVGRKDWFG
ncbi:hypothetical protein SBOR_8615 [Sclerotinia borealis F-4128]|uniref:Methyltransferase domain-containing protein n=1 Tax=Sclerotinia borealis (strain F-4128) TaxID=1432307 RepID=W9C554_SCLBF|nr:hypothetical protein SBOR_8615 [Sclerotinia borealis F-4128]